MPARSRSWSSWWARLGLLGLQLERRRAARLERVELQPVRDVVLVDVPDVDHRLVADATLGDELDIVEPHVRIEAFLPRFGTQAGDASRPAVIGRDREQCPVLLVEPLRVEVA